MTVDQLTLIEAENKIRDEIAAKEDELRSRQRERRRMALIADVEVARERKKALDAAATKVSGLAVAVDAAIEHLEDLNARKVSDTTVTGFDLTVATEDVKLAKDRLKAGEVEMAAARRAYEKASRDRHLSEYAADVIEPVVGVPVFVHALPETAPDVSPAIILTQSTPTRGWGTIDVTGDVAITVKGDPVIDWAAIRAAFDATGSTVTISGGVISFADTLFPVPILHKPTATALVSLGEDVGKTWKIDVENRPTLVADRGGEYLTTGDGYYAVEGYELISADDGHAVGKLRMLLGTTLHQDRERVRVRVADAVASVFDVGSLYTSMGQLDGYEVLSVENHDHDWNPRRIYINPADVPRTYAVEIEVTATYEVPTVALVAD